MKVNRKVLLAVIASLLLGACVGQPDLTTQYQPLVHQSHMPAPDISLDIEGLSNCTNAISPTISLDSTEPVIVVVHGCFASSGRFRSLADGAIWR